MSGNAFFWYKKNVFVTGAAGLLGGWLIQELLTQGAQVICLVRDVTPYSLLYKDRFHQKVTVVQGALEDLYTIERVINEYDIDTVFHLGAQAIVGHASRSPLSTFKSNIEGTWNILEACRVSPWVKRIVVASSDKAYGESLTLPYTEDMPLQGSYPYDVSKSCTDLIAQSYIHTYGLPVCITRCGNIFGGGDLHLNRLIPGTIDAFLQQRPPVIRSDGSLIRDYVYVEDIVDAYLLLAQSMDLLDVRGHAFNISEEKPKTVLQVVGAIKNIMGTAIDPIIENKTRHEIKAQYLSAQKIRDIVGWAPKYGFLEGLIKTINWYQHNNHALFSINIGMSGVRYNEL